MLPYMLLYAVEYVNLHPKRNTMQEHCQILNTILQTCPFHHRNRVKSFFYPSQNTLIIADNQPGINNQLHLTQGHHSQKN